MKLKLMSVLALFLVFTPRIGMAQNPEVAKPTDPQLKYSEAELGAIIHLDLEIYKPEIFWKEHLGKDQISKALPLELFNPSKLNTDDWVKAVKDMGGKYAVLVAKHTSGFALWPTEAYDYHVGNTPWKEGKGDIVADFIKSCKKYGILPGIYCSYAANAYSNVDGGRVLRGNELQQDEYNKIYTTMVSELWAGHKYGNKELFTIWFDGGIPEKSAGGPDLISLVEESINPVTNVFNGPAYTKNIVRWVGNETGDSPYPFYIPVNLAVNKSGYYTPENYHGSASGAHWVPGEADFPLREDHTWVQAGWFWNAKNQRVMSAPELLKKYYTSVGSNTNMLLGLVVDTTGQIPKEDLAVLKEFGGLLKKFDRPVAKSQGSTEIVITLKKPRQINTLLIQENIAEGQRVTQYMVEALVNGQWKKIADGQTIGHKRIQEFETVSTSKVKLTITESISPPIIKNFSLYKF